ncbi:MAG: chorismate-binding protein [Terriglobia bacterium]
MQAPPEYGELRLDHEHVYRFGGMQRLDLSIFPEPSAALDALDAPAAALLESRTQHPCARYSYLGLSPRIELRLYPNRLTARKPQGTPWLLDAADPLITLLDHLETVRCLPGAGEAPFQGGWIGWLAHEAGALLLNAPVADPAPPARPFVPLGVFRLCADVLVLDHHTRKGWLTGCDWGEGEAAVRERLETCAQALQAASAPMAAMAVVRDDAAVTLNPAQFAHEQEKLQALIHAGDCFQVNLTSSWAYPWQVGTPSRAELAALYTRYVASNPGAWCGFFPDEEISLLSGSPELLVNWQGGDLAMRPIAGTRPRSANPVEDAVLANELRTDAKEQAEHAMLVDLARNDLASVCVPASVQVTSLAGVERYRHVMHLVSEVTGEARADLSLPTLLQAVFPGGTVTGAPKRRAVTRIAECERGPRGPYTGALGYVGLGGASQWNLLIRTLTATPTHLAVHAGCGIVAASEAANEAAELASKARAQVESALGRGTSVTDADRCGVVEQGPAWRPGSNVESCDQADVLIVDFEDSFVHNLADYARTLGARVRVASIHSAPEPWWSEPVTHLILSPGPGEPDDFPAWRVHLAEARKRDLPVLGICLGHQAMATAGGARVRCHHEPMHGRWSELVRTEAAAVDPLFGAWKPTRVGRYHSLVVSDSTERMVPLATLEDGTLMAVRYRGVPHWGLQFHPESLLTEDGMDLMQAFLRCGP